MRVATGAKGLTAYLADHLIKEQRGQGALYRRDALQRYRSYVQEGEDFPLAQFRSRHSGATEAVGYGKTLMGFHMLRRRLGDEAFVTVLRDVYRKHRGHKASFDDLRRSFERASEEDLGRFFSEWTTRPGAAALELKVDRISRGDEGYGVAGRVVQTQSAEPFALDLPLVLSTEAGALTSVLRLEGRVTEFRLESAEQPLALLADPAFDVFRLLDPREVPPSIGQIFGEPEILAILPAGASDEAQARYRELMDAWSHDGHVIDVRTDAEVDSLPADRAAWILGRDNRFGRPALRHRLGDRLRGGCRGPDGARGDDLVRRTLGRDRPPPSGRPG